MIALITAFSGIIWFIVDRLKDTFWKNLSYSKWLTLAAAVILSIANVFCFKLDLLFGLNLSDSITYMGQIMTIFVLMSGSSGVSEIVDKIRANKNN